MVRSRPSYSGQGAAPAHERRAKTCAPASPAARRSSTEEVVETHRCP